MKNEQRKMKNSGVYYIGSIPIDYETIRYKYLSDVKMGNTILESETSTEMDNEYKIAVYSATQSDKIFGYVKEAQDILKKGDIVIPARGNSIGCAKLVTKDNSTSTQTTIMSYNIRNVNNKYLFYCSWAFKDEWYRYDGSAIPQITVRQVENNMLPLPNALLQGKIVSELDKKVNIIDELIKNQEQQIEKLKEYKQSLITEVVTKGLDKNVEMKDSGVEWIGEIPKDWQVIKLKYIATEILKGKGITKDEVIEDGEVFCVRYGEIYSKYDTSFDNCISKTSLNMIENPVYFEKGNILFAGTGELIDEIGKNILYTGEFKCLAGGDIIILKHKLDPKFLNYALNSIYVQKQKSRGKMKLKVAHISATEIGNLLVVLPKIEEQVRISEHLDDKCIGINKIISLKKIKIEKLNEYKKSLIYEYVTGKKEV